MGLEIEYIYGQTPLSEEEMEGLLIEHITTRGELDEFEQLNIEKAIEWIMNNKFNTEYILSEKCIKDLHMHMLADVWTWAGTYRKSNKNIGVDKYQIPTEISLLNVDCNYWILNKTFDDVEIAIRYKHRLVSIHPFSNGNGRHSRLMADIIINHIFRKKDFPWGNENLTPTNTNRKKYIKALHQADEGDITPLLEFATQD
jgi:Fic-DOC domain mobile mystery protein B